MEISLNILEELILIHFFFAFLKLEVFSTFITNNYHSESSLADEKSFLFY